MLKKLTYLVCVIAMVSAQSKLSKEKTVTCGVSKVPSGYIVQGQRFLRGDFPWTVALMYSNGIDLPAFFCAGTLISSTFVVSGRLNFESGV